MDALITHVISNERWEKNKESEKFASRLLLSYCGFHLFSDKAEKDTYRKSMRKTLCRDCAKQYIVHRNHGFTDDPIPVELLFPGRVTLLKTA